MRKDIKMIIATLLAILFVISLTAASDSELIGSNNSTNITLISGNCTNTEVIPDNCTNTYPIPGNCTSTEVIPDNCTNTNSIPENCTNTCPIPENCTNTDSIPGNTTQVNANVETKQLVTETDNITESDNGKTLNLKNGETFNLKLYDNPSTGYSWQLNVSKGLCILSDNYIQYPEPPGYVGGGGTHLWIIKAVTQGSQQVKGIYKQSWMETTGTEENFTLHVEVI
jgi:inhibitor of cysteine peptidase